MIRINLLAAERPTQKKKAAAVGGGGAAPGGLQAVLLLGAFMAMAVFGSAAAWWLKAAEIDRLDTQIAAARKRQQELQVIKQQVEMFQRKKALLDAKVQLIERLKAEQPGPVHMLDEISKALPDLVWLTSLDQSGMTVRLVGEASGFIGVADFITNLQRSGWFPNVELVEANEAERIYRFTLTAQFKPQPEPGAEAAPGAAPAAASPR
jgi:type IV pilus assembly protein PilN